MLGVMDNQMAPVKAGGKPPDEKTGSKVKSANMKSPQAGSKVKSATINMFFKTPPKQPVKTVKSPTTLLGYFKPVTSDGQAGSKVKSANADGHKLQNGHMDSKEGSGSDGSAQNGVNAAEGNQVKKVSAKKTEKKTEESKTKPKPKAKDKKSASDQAGKKDKEKSGIKSKQGQNKSTKKLTEKGRKAGSKVKGQVDVNQSLDDFEMTETNIRTTNKGVENAGKEKKGKAKSKPEKASKKTANAGEKDVALKNKNMPDEDHTASESTSISYEDFLHLDSDVQKTEDVNEQNMDKDEAKSHKEEAKSPTNVMSYADFLSQSSEEDEDDVEEDGSDKNKSAAKNNESRELSDDDMNNATTTEESEDVSMDETGTTSDEDVFQDDDEEDDSSSDSKETGDTKTKEVVESGKSERETKPTPPVKKDEKPTTPAKKEDNDDDVDDLCVPKRKEVTITAEVHTPPVVTPSTSPNHSPSTGKIKSNVVVDASDGDFEVIMVEEMDVDNKSEKKNTFGFSGNTTPKRDANDVIKPAPTKVYSIFEKRSTKKATSECKNKNDGKSKVGAKKAAEGKAESVSKEKKKDRDTGGKNSKTRLFKKEKEQDMAGKKSDETSRLAEEKKKEEDAADKNSETPRRKSTGRRAAVKARKDILQQELRREESGVSDSATSQEDLPVVKKKTLHAFFHSETDTDASDHGANNKKTASKRKCPDEPVESGVPVKKRGRPRKTSAADDGVNDAVSPVRKSGRPRKTLSVDDDGKHIKGGRSKSSSGGKLADDDSNVDKTPAKGRKGRPKGKDSDETPGKKRRRSIVTSTPKEEKPKKSAKKAKAQELLQKAKTRRSSSTCTSPEKLKKTSPTKAKKSAPKSNKSAPSESKKTPAKTKKATPAKAKNSMPSRGRKSRMKSDDSVVEVLDSSKEEVIVAETKPLRNFTDVLGKKPIAKDSEVNKKKGAGNDKKKTGPASGADKKKQEKSTVDAKKTPKADEKKKEPEAENKVPLKLCPLFTKEGRLAAAKKQAEMIEAQTNSQASQDTLIILSDDDSNDTRLSQGGGDASSCGPLSFSKALNAARRSEQEKKAQELPYPAFPSVSHVLQKGDAESQLWNLPDANLQLQAPNTSSLSQANASDLTLGSVTLCEHGEETNVKAFGGHPQFSPETQKVLLEDISKCNPKVQAKRLFRRYLAKKNGDPIPASKPTDKSSDKFTKLKSGQPSSGKRKSEAILEGEDGGGRRKRSRKDPDKNAEPRELRRSKRRSTQSKEELNSGKGQDGTEVKGQEKVKEKDEATLKAERLASMMWTEKYQPTCGLEVMGNTACVKKLNGWLDEWRKKFLKEKKKIKKQQMKGANKKDKELSDSDSDFDLGDDYSDSDYSDDDDFLCKTMLISGPSGAGKTAAVYGCAQEHGFKVFEVNAASRRVGRQILTELGEATQSHHLATKAGPKTGGISSFFTPGPKMSPSKSPRKKKAAEPKKKPPMPKVFANFFKVATDDKSKKTANSPKSNTKAKNKKQKGKEEPPAVTMVIKKKTTNASTEEKTLPSSSIILFEEVDVVFEEDKGFLAAIASFMETTKRPIILTTSDPEFASKFEGNYESLVFRRPSQTLLATHLQLLALAENVFTSPTDMKLLAQHLNCDIRHTILALQYWAASGAKHTRNTKDSIQHVSMETDSVSRNEETNSRTESSTKDCDDVESKLTLIGEYHGCAKGKDAVSSTSKGRDPDMVKRYEEMMQNEAVRHDSCLECIMGLCNVTEHGLIAALQGPESVSTLPSRSSAAETYQHQAQSEITYDNYYKLLRHKVAPSNPSPASSSSSNTRTVLGKKLVSATAKYLDHMSFMDATLPPVHDGIPPSGCCSNQGWWQANFKASMFDLYGNEEDDNSGHHDNVLQSKIRSSVEVLSFSVCRRKHEQLLKELDSLVDKDNGNEPSSDGSSKQEEEGDGDKGNNPSGDGCNEEEAKEEDGDILPCMENFDTLKVRTQEAKCPDVYSVLLQRLPSHIYCNHPSVTCDYLPLIRQICRSERWRKEAALKRRFLHYLDYNNIGLKPTDYLKLASALDVQPQKPLQEDSFLSAI